MISLEAQDIAYDFAAAHNRYMHILDEEPDSFKVSKRKLLAEEAYRKACACLFDYIADLEAKAGIECG